MRIFFAICLLLAAACTDQLPESVGPAQEILVLADPADREAVEGPLRDVFEKVLYTPQEEKVFWLKYGSVEDFERYRYSRRKNLLIVAPISAQHATARFLRNLLSSEVQVAVQAGASPVLWKENVWAQEQLLIAVSGQDRAALADNIRLEADRLYRAVEEARNSRIRRLIYRYGERKDVTAHLAREYGWSVRVAFGYRILEALPDSGFVVLSKDNPNRWLFVYWEDGVPPDALSPDWCIQKRDDITRRFFDGDRAVPTEVAVSQAEFAGKLAYELQGLWENERTWAGGPFKSYAFVDVDLNRFYFIDVGVYAPNKKKEPYLRQVDLLARSFTLVDSLTR